MSTLFLAGGPAESQPCTCPPPAQQPYVTIKQSNSIYNDTLRAFGSPQCRR